MVSRMIEEQNMILVPADEYEKLIQLEKKIIEVTLMTKEFPDSRVFEGTEDTPFNIDDYLHEIAIWFKCLREVLK